MHTADLLAQIAYRMGVNVQHHNRASEATASPASAISRRTLCAWAIKTRHGSSSPSRLQEPSINDIAERANFAPRTFSGYSRRIEACAVTPQFEESSWFAKIPRDQHEPCQHLFEASKILSGSLEGGARRVANDGMRAATPTPARHGVLSATRWPKATAEPRARTRKATCEDARMRADWPPGHCAHSTTTPLLDQSAEPSRFTRWGRTIPLDDGHVIIVY